MASSHGCWELVLLCISSVLICNLSAGFASIVSSGGSVPKIHEASCELNFTGFPYEPTGDCINFGKSQRKPTPQFCRNVLTALTHTLALRSCSSQGNFFIGQDQWRNCGSNFTKQPSVSMESCGYDDLFYGSIHCSRLSLLGIVGRQSLIAALKECSNFNSSFSKACRKCVHTIMRARDDLMVGDEGEKTVCEVAVVIAIAASKLDKPDLVYKFERCLPALDNIGSDNYIEIKLDYTDSLSNEKVVCLEKGSAGHVYKGILPSGQVMAIKYITHHLANAFKWEVEGLSRVCHPNLGYLFGYCIEDGKHYLVDEYCSGGNLAEHLQREDAVLTWKTRVKILRDCAVALRYLHQYANGYIVHGNIKLTNILLTDNMEAKISNFVLGKMLKMEETKVFTELLSRKKALELDLSARDQLTRKARDVLMGLRPLSDFEDHQLNGNINGVDFRALLLVAVLCIAESSKDQSNVDDVCEETDRAWKSSWTVRDTTRSSEVACIQLQNMPTNS